MINYKVEYVNLNNGHTYINTYQNIKTAIDAVSELMYTSSDKYRITITINTNG